MKHVTTVIASVAFSAIGAAAAQAGESPLTQEGHWECRSSPPTGTVYFSAVFDKTTDMTAIDNAFAQMLKAKYGYNGQVSCSMAYMSGSTLAKLQGDQKSYVVQLHAAGTKVVETGWILGSSSQAEYFCDGVVTVVEGGQQVGYFYTSPIQSVAADKAASLPEAWRIYLKGLHPSGQVNLATCSMPPLDAEKRKAWIATFDTQWQGKAKVVHTDWKFDPATAPAPVADH